MAFTCFDGAVAPVLIASTDFKIIYANFSAQRRFPFLTDEKALLARYDAADLRKAYSALKEGDSYSLPYEDSLGLSLVLTPSFSPSEGLDHICVYVSYDEDSFRDLFPLMTDNELIYAMKKDLIPSLHYLAMQTKFGEGFINSGQGEKSKHVYRTMRRKILHQMLFVSQVSESHQERKGDYSLCDASAVLDRISRVFKNVKYKPSEVCVVPVEREPLILLFTDLLANLTFRQKDAKIRVSSCCEDDGVSICFASGPLVTPLNVPCEEAMNGIDMGNYSVRRKMESYGGSVLVKRGVRGAVNVTLKFPYPRGILRIPELNDHSARRLSIIEEAALEYLSLIADLEPFSF